MGVVESKLDAIKAAMITGDIPQNVNFAVHSEIVTSFLDSYAIHYGTATGGEEKPISELVSMVLPAMVVIECIGQTPAAPSPAVVPGPIIDRGQSAESGLVQRSLEVTQAFYSALSNADGVTASKLVIPEKRTKGAFSAFEISRFYSSLSVPLRVLRIRPEYAETITVTYQYGLPNGRSCRGTSLVTLTARAEELLIESIRANSSCSPPSAAIR